MNISSSSLFHFTNSLDNLESIISVKGFFPRFCLESQDNLRDNLELYYPMVCFCDIPLSKITKHMDMYGGYGIALRREWGITCKLTPVLYPDKDTRLSNMIANGIEESLNDDGIASMIKPLITVTKARVGRMYRHPNGYVENVNFYDEREWRYVPYNYSTWFEYKSDSFKYDKIIEHNRKLKAYKLDFSLKDVAYILVQSSSDLEKISEITSNISVLVWDDIKNDI